MKKTLLFLVVVAGCLCLLGCFTTPAALTREQAVYNAGTNGLAFISKDVLPLLPAPYGPAAGAAVTLIGGALAGWNAWQQKQIVALKAEKAEKANKPTPPV